VDVLEIGPLHNILEKRWSEPCWVENFPMILNENSAEVKRIAPWDTRATTYRSRKRRNGASGARLAEEVANAPLRACVLLEYIVVLQFFTPI